MLLTIISSLIIVSAAQTLFNPFTGKLDFVNFANDSMLCLRNGTNCPGNFTFLIGANSTYNASYAIWAYNQTYSGSTYNITYAGFAYNHTSVANSTIVAAYGKWFYNMSGGSGASYNDTYHLYASYNTSLAANNSLYLAYGKWWYNMTDGVGNGSASMDYTNILMLNASRNTFIGSNQQIYMDGNNSLLGGTPDVGGINFNQTIAEGKMGIWWNAYDSFSGLNRPVAWLVAHYNSSSGNGIHQHFSIETLDNNTGTPSINSHFEIAYGSNMTNARVAFPNSYVDSMIVNDIFSMENDNIDFKSDLATRIYPSGQSTLAFSVNNDTTGNITLAALGSTGIRIPAGDNFYVDYNITADSLKANSNICLGSTCIRNLSLIYNHTALIESVYGKWFYNMSDGTGVGTSYNATYALWAYNQSQYIIDTYGQWFYNMSDGSGTGTSFNITYDTWLPNYTASRIYWYNMTYSGSTFNTTYAGFAYNQTTPAISSLNTSYNKFWYNMTYSGSTYNATYAPYAYNFSTVPITVQQTSNTNLSNVQSINFTNNACFITSNATCIMQVCGGFGGTVSATCTP